MLGYITLFYAMCLLIHGIQTICGVRMGRYYTGFTFIEVAAYVAVVGLGLME